MKLHSTILIVFISLHSVASSSAQDTWVKNRWIDHEVTESTNSSESRGLNEANVMAPARQPNARIATAQLTHSPATQQVAQAVDNRPSPATQVAASNAATKTVNYETEYRMENYNDEPEASTIPDFHLKARNASDISIDKPKHHHPTKNFKIYRDREKYPVDPRKPCNDCVRPCEKGPFTKCDIPALFGRPHMDKEQGGCLCGKKRCRCKGGLTNLYWPRPFSAKLDEKYPNKAAQRYTNCQETKLVDVFDRLEDFKLINYTRRDNGHVGAFFGTNREVFGCLGESKQLSRVYGIGFRDGAPIQRGMMGQQIYHSEDSVTYQTPTPIESTPTRPAQVQSNRVPTIQVSQPRAAYPEKYPLDQKPEIIVPNRDYFQPYETYAPGNQGDEKPLPRKRIGSNSLPY